MVTGARPSRFGRQLLQEPEAAGAHDGRREVQVSQDVRAEVLHGQRGIGRHHIGHQPLLRPAPGLLDPHGAVGHPRASPQQVFEHREADHVTADPDDTLAPAVTGLEGVVRADVRQGQVPLVEIELKQIAQSGYQEPHLFEVEYGRVRGRLHRQPTIRHPGPDVRVETEHVLDGGPAPFDVHPLHARRLEKRPEFRLTLFHERRSGGILIEIQDGSGGEHRTSARFLDRPQFAPPEIAYLPPTLDPEAFCGEGPDGGRK